MNKKKSIIFTLLFITAFITAGYILYSNQEVVTPNSPEEVSLDPTPLEIKGETINAPTKKTNREVIISSTEYVKKNAPNHINLTRENILWFTNYERVKAGLTPLLMNKALTFSSSKKNDDMIQYQYFNHTRKTNPPIGFDSFIDNEKYDFIKIGENLAMGDFSTSPEVVTAWMKSPNHKKNILDPLYSEIGIAVTLGTMNGKEVILITQHFGDPRNSCPTVNDSTREAIDILKSKIQIIQERINTEQKKITTTNQTFNASYSAIIDEYNVLVNTYNKSIGDMAELVGFYNKQVRLFDNCIKGKR
jgi:uncharacterized protein YkwD